MKIKCIAHALPADRYGSDQIASWTGSDEKFIVNKIGLSERRFLAADETASDLAVAAMQALFVKAADLSAADIDALIVVTQTPDFAIPHMSAQLQARLCLNSSTACFDLNLGCSGWVYALAVTKGLGKVLGLKNALIVTCDPYSKIMARGDRATVPVFGDAAACTWLSTESGAEIGEFETGTDGNGANGLILRGGRAAAPLVSVHGPGDIRESAKSLFMDGRAILDFMLTRIPGSVNQCLAKNNLSDDDIDYYVFHQASRYMVNLLASRMELDARAPFLAEKVGNTVSSSIPIALEMLQQRETLTGKRILVSGFGVGLSWASTVLSY